MQEIMSRIVLDNAVVDWLWALTIFTAIFAAAKATKSVVAHRLKKLAARTKTHLDDLLASYLERLGSPLLAALALIVAAHSLRLPFLVFGIVKALLIVIITMELVRLFKELIAESMAAPGDRPTSGARAMLGSLSLIVQLVIWTGAVLLILDNLGFQISAMLTGLGIGGVAVALAAQAVLGDLFSCFAIHLDRPFVVGDFIIVDDLMGEVERVGLKTTRIRSLWGEQLVFSNHDLTSSRIRNFKRMQERRVLFKFGVEYGTSAEKVARIPSMVKEIIEAQAETRFEYSAFRAFGESSLDFETVYFVMNDDYPFHLRTQQQINLDLMRAFEREGIAFAFPTRTVHVVKENSPA